jgi:cell pole-organizing protein PopZ
VKQDGEPSVEEILESIKKVIARDNRETAEEERRRREGQGLGIRTFAVSEELDAGDDAEVLDLDETIEMTSEDERPAGLTTERTAGAMRESLAALAMLAEPGAPPQIVRSGETSLEGLVRELLRPMLAQWLEVNLPQIVDRMVQAEIARIAGKKG